MNRTKGGAIGHLISATRYSCQGLRHAWASQAAFRYEIYVLILALPLAGIIGKSAVERALLMGSAMLVIIVELLNSAIEATVDRIGQEFHEMSGHAKDMASAAVFTAVLLAVMVWLMILLA